MTFFMGVKLYLDKKRFYIGKNCVKKINSHYISFNDLMRDHSDLIPRGVDAATSEPVCMVSM